MPADGEGFLVMHLERRRFYGHPSLIRAIHALGLQAAQHALGVLQIGDLSQARGGPMPFGHRSHQTGLDADIWFNLDPGLYARTDALRANIGAPSLLNLARKGLDRTIWSARHVTLLELAARAPGVDRIFVNPYIKRELCATVKGDRSWLRRLRPWHGHDDHFHIRLVCPPDSPDCGAQEVFPRVMAAMPLWTGGLNHTRRVHQRRPKPPLPAKCSVVLGTP
ncbi:MAG: penicillin-insensitive murein endopeptidase [Chromatiales bacterium]|nr:penicillin-insensitive murein endopeptidase [Chromatiales bacterium]